MRSPSWLIPVLDADQVREVDRHAITELGVKGLDLMTAAAYALAAEVSREAKGGRIAVFAGKGNNGGDGLALTTILRNEGLKVDVFAVESPDLWVGDAGLMLKGLAGPAPEALSAGSGNGCSVAVDCILGTGARGAPSGNAALAVSRINELAAAGAAVVACDIPSGVNASTGEVEPPTVKARTTVTFHAMKPGLWIHPGKGKAGRTVCADIGLSTPPTMLGAAGLIGDGVCASLPERGAGDDKFSSGSVLVVGGSPGLTGAPMLAALGAARGGAGYVTVGLPSGLMSASDLFPEIMGLALGQSGNGGGHIAASADLVVKMLTSGHALVLGPGLGRTDEAAALVLTLLRRTDTPTVVDADGLRCLATTDLNGIDLGSNVVLTPHTGEMAALLGVPRAEVDAHRLDCTRGLSKRTGAIVVLKGDDTLIARPDGLVAISPGDAPALATAGSGDVLAGIIGGLLGRGVEPFHAACAAVRLHVQAGRIVGLEGPEGVMATDIASALPQARAALRT
ncbi:MAG: NAD(P)H-hydrate dehydratase [Actinobacteria bacterium]|uniref:Nicotinamide nucleotide repair protein n=1 Tax=freshwater metagenome TaxID=449393 RepID=A0A6J7DYS1_9ZZZZ|nr:NAD(P)H-hydrate dehydratase [Actinomycetota bacterium]